MLNEYSCSLFYVSVKGSEKPWEVHWENNMPKRWWMYGNNIPEGAGKIKYFGGKISKMQRVVYSFY